MYYVVVVVVVVSEVVEAIDLDRIKLKKAAGIDGVPGEFWKCLGENSLKELIDICQTIYRTRV